MREPDESPSKSEEDNAVMVPTVILSALLAGAALLLFSLSHC